MSKTVYVKLLDEGTDVWRPVEAQPLGHDLYRILSATPEDERWAFSSGEIVRCVPRRFEGQDALVAVEANH